MTQERAQPTDDDHQVLPFRPRGRATSGGHGWRWRPRDARPDAPEDLAKYERGEIEDDYRHRMIVNIAGLIFTVLLATAGAWLAVSIADMRKNQDCYLSGRRNCTPVDVQALQGR